MRLLKAALIPLRFSWATGASMADLNLIHGLEILAAWFLLGIVNAIASA